MNVREVVQSLTKEAGMFGKLFQKVAPKVQPPPLTQLSSKAVLPESTVSSPHAGWGQAILPVAGAAYLGSNLLGGSTTEPQQQNNSILGEGSNLLGGLMRSLMNRPQPNQINFPNYEVPENYPMPLNEIKSASINSTLKIINSLKNLGHREEKPEVVEKKDSKIIVKTDPKNQSIVNDPKVKEYLNNLLK